MFPVWKCGLKATTVFETFRDGLHDRTKPRPSLQREQNSLLKRSRGFSLSHQPHILCDSKWRQWGCWAGVTRDWRACLNHLTSHCCPENTHTAAWNNTNCAFFSLETADALVRSLFPHSFLQSHVSDVWISHTLQAAWIKTLSIAFQQYLYFYLSILPCLSVCLFYNLPIHPSSSHGEYCWFVEVRFRRIPSTVVMSVLLQM